MSGPSERDEIAAVLAELREDLYQKLRDGEDATAYAIGAVEAIEDRVPDWLAERDRRAAAKTLREAADAGPSTTPTDELWRMLLRDRADRIERDE